MWLFLFPLSKWFCHEDVCGMHILVEHFLSSLLCLEIADRLKSVFSFSGHSGLGDIAQFSCTMSSMGPGTMINRSINSNITKTNMYIRNALWIVMTEMLTEQWTYWRSQSSQNTLVSQFCMPIYGACLPSFLHWTYSVPNIFLQFVCSVSFNLCTAY